MKISRHQLAELIQRMKPQDVQGALQLASQRIGAQLRLRPSQQHPPFTHYVAGFKQAATVLDEKTQLGEAMDQEGVSWSCKLLNNDKAPDNKFYVQVV
jgi:hypothetical protein